jgi:CBS-domain-containing membrane protein
MDLSSPKLRPDAATIAIGGAGVLVTALALGLMTTPSSAFLAPFASTAAIKYAAPDNQMAQPRSVLGGHFLGVLAGILVGVLIGGFVLGPAIAATVAMLAMIATRTLHPPAVAVAIIACQHHLHPLDSLAAVALAATVSTLCAIVLYRVLHRQSYPSAGWAEGLLGRPLGSEHVSRPQSASRS